MIREDECADGRGGLKGNYENGGMGIGEQGGAVRG